MKLKVIIISFRSAIFMRSHFLAPCRFAEVGIDIGGLEPTVVKTIELIDSGDGTTGARVHVYDKVCRELITTEREVAWQQMQRDPDEIPPPAVPPPGAPAAGREGS